jgi:hypothetical protein
MKPMKHLPRPIKMRWLLGRLVKPGDDTRKIEMLEISASIGHVPQTCEIRGLMQDAASSCA